MKKRVICLLLCALLTLPFGWWAAADSATKTTGDYTYTVNAAGEATLVKYNGTAANVTIPTALNGHKLTAIGEKAFMSCETLQKVTVPGTVRTVGDAAFGWCDQLTTVVLQEGVESLKSNVFLNDTMLTSVSLPDSLKHIGEFVFSFCTHLMKITLPKNVTECDLRAFTCYFPGSISVAADNPVFSSYNGALYNKNKTTLLRVPTTTKTFTVPVTVTTIGDYAFGECGKLTDVQLPPQLKVLGEQAFDACIKLTSLTLPDTLTAIGKHCFTSCAFEEIVVPNGVETIPKGAFWNCRQLKNVQLPATVTSIGESAFCICEALEEITLPEGLQTIESNAFYQCTNLKKIVLPASLTEVYPNSFYACHPALVVYGYENEATAPLQGETAYTFVALNRTLVVDETTGAVLVLDKDDPAADGQLKVEMERIGEQTVQFTVSFTRNGVPLEPTDTALLRLRIPDGFLLPYCTLQQPVEDGDPVILPIHTTAVRRDMPVMLEIAPPVNGTFLLVQDTSHLLWGDACLDGYINARDALAVLRHAVGKEPLSDQLCAIADVNGDGTINARDALLMLRFAVGKIQSFPVQDLPVTPTDPPVWTGSL